jgi:hypothetical protein
MHALAGARLALAHEAATRLHICRLQQLPGNELEDGLPQHVALGEVLQQQEREGR